MYIFTPWLNEQANHQTQEWGYFNYFIYYLVESSGGAMPVPFAKYPGSPVPHKDDRTALLIFLAIELVLFFGAFILVRRYSLKHPEALDNLISDRVKFKANEASTDWEKVGFHRPLSGLLVGMGIGILLFIPLIIYQNLILPQFILPSAQALGMWGRVTQLFLLTWTVFDLGTFGSRNGRFDYFPVDEKHPTYNSDDYALSKWVMEMQADSFFRRFPELTVSSLRFHALPDEPPELLHSLDDADAPVARTLWGWTLMSEAARACECAILANFIGHEVFFITAPRTASAIPSLELAQHAYPHVPIRGDLSGHKSFYDCSKAAQLLGWTHSNT